MNQPCHLEQPPPDSGPIKPDPGIPAAWMILIILVAVAIFEIWALTTDHNTISQLTQRLGKGRIIIQILGIAGMALLGWHLWRGGPFW